MDVQKTELFKQLKSYLGKDNWEAMRHTSKLELSLFQKFVIDLNKSYFIKGSQDLLMKFKAFYLTRCLKKHPLYVQCSINDYVEGLVSADRDEFGLNVSKDLLFLYVNRHLPTLGNSRLFQTEITIGKIADRNRDGLITVVLSETSVSEFEQCGEMDIINLYESVQSSNTKVVLSTIERRNYNETSRTNGYD